MRVTSINAEGILSFDSFGLALNPDMTVLVGPNGSGKSNVVRVVDLIRCVARRYSHYRPEDYTILTRFASSRHFRSDFSSAIKVKLALELTTQAELSLMATFIQVVIANSVLDDRPVDLSQLRNWVEDGVNVDSIAPLASGVLCAEHKGDPTEPWSLAFEFESETRGFRWLLAGWRYQDSIVTRDEQFSGQLSAFGPPPRTRTGEELFEGALPWTEGLPTLGEIVSMSQNEFVLPTEFEPLRKLAEMLGTQPDEMKRQRLTLTRILNQILDEGVVILRELRSPLRNTYELVGEGVPPLDVESVPWWLFESKNAKTETERVRYRQSQDLFSELTKGDTFDLGASFTRGENAALEVTPIINVRGRPVLAEYAGAGRVESLVLSTFLAGSRDRFVILDEPAANLHPGIQNRLLSVLERLGAQILLVTHSPYLIPRRKLERVVRFHVDEFGASSAHRCDLFGKTATKAPELFRFAEVRALLFAAGVILVEGGTELGALPKWFAESSTAKKDGTPDDMNVTVFSVDGDSNFGRYVGLLQALQIPWAIVCDGAALNPSGRRFILRQLADATRDQALTDEVGLIDGSWSFERIKDLVRQYGVFSLAQGSEQPDESFEAALERILPGALGSARTQVGASKPRAGALLAETHDCPQEVDLLHADLVKYLQGAGL